MSRRIVLGGVTLLLAAVVLIALARGTDDSSTPDAPKRTAAGQGGPVEACTGLPPARGIEPVVAPGADIPADKARFSGAWEGKAGNEYVGLVVTNITPTEATSFHAYGNLRGRLVSQFRPDGSLQHGGNQQITYSWSFGSTPNVLESVRLEGNDRVAYTMKKCTLQP